MRVFCFAVLVAFGLLYATANHYGHPIEVAATSAAGPSASAAEDFGITENEFVQQYNRNVGNTGAKIRVVERERADDGNRDVVTYAFGRLCVRALGSTDRKTKVVSSMTIVPYEKGCPPEFSPDATSVLAIGAMIMRVLTDESDLGSAMRALTDLGMKLRTAGSVETKYGGRTISLFAKQGLFFLKILPD